MMKNKPNFRASALVVALALGASAPIVAHASSRDASFADSMAVGGDTSTTYQRVERAAPVAGPAVWTPVAMIVPQAEVATAQPDAPVAAAPAVTAAAASTAAPVSEPVAQADQLPVLVAVTETVVVVDTAPAASEAPTPRVIPVATLDSELITREQVRDELRIARQAGTVSRTGELADTNEVLVARDAFNAAQTDAIVAEYRAEYDRQVALIEAESRLAQLEASVASAAIASSSVMDDQPLQRRSDVVDMSGE